MDTWPTEVLFSFFRSLSPFTLRSYSTVCKKWSQMCFDNELWRQFCFERWSINPKESDCSKNWLIPVRQGVGQKENRIDWRKVYLLRDLADKANNALDNLVPKKRKRGAKPKKAQAKKDFFGKGWIEVKDLPAFESYITQECAKMQGEMNGPKKEFMHVVNFHLEFELLMLKQINFSRVKHLGLTATFLNNNSFTLTDFVGILPVRLAKTTKQYYELAVQKDVPLEAMAKHIEGVVATFELYPDDLEFPQYGTTAALASLIETIIACIEHYPLGNALAEWTSEEFSDDDRSPTHEFEESLNTLSVFIGEAQKSLFWGAINHGFLIPKKIHSSVRTFNTVLAVVAAVSEGFKNEILQDLPMFIEKYVLPFFQGVQNDPTALVSTFYYFSTTLPALGYEIQLKYSDIIIPFVLNAADVQHSRVQFHIGQFLLAYCEHLTDPNILVPYMPALLTKLLNIITTSSAVIVKEKIIFAISSLLITCHTTFAQYKDSVMTAFKKLLSMGDKKDRDAVIEALSRIAAGVGDQKESIAQDVESLYAQVVEDFKADRPANEELLIKLTEFGVTAVGKGFTKYLPVVFPIVYQHATAEVIIMPENLNMHDNQDNEDNQEDENQDEDEDEEMMENIDGFKLDDKEMTLKSAALAAIGNFILTLDREAILPYFDQINDALRRNVSGQGTLELITAAADIYLEFTEKIFMPNMEAELVSKMKPFIRNLIEPFLSVIELEEIPTKEQVLTNFNSMLTVLVKNSPADQPLLDDEMTALLLNMTVVSMQQVYSIEDIDLEEKHDFGFEVVNLFETVCRNTANKQNFLPAAMELFGLMTEECNHRPPDEHRWADLCIMVTTFEFYGQYFQNFNMMQVLAYIWSCRNVDSRYTQQAIAYNLAVNARKFPEYLPQDVTPIFVWLETLLTPNYRRTRQPVYDNALLAYGYLIERTTDQQKFIGHTRRLISSFPPAHNGDIDEGNRCIETLIRLVSSGHANLLLTDAALVADLIRALNETLQIEAYNTDANRSLIGPLLESLKASTQI